MASRIQTGTMRKQGLWRAEVGTAKKTAQIWKQTNGNIWRKTLCNLQAKDELQVSRIMMIPQNFYTQEPHKNDIYFDLVSSNNQADLLAMFLFADERPMWINVGRKDAYSLPVAWEDGVLSWNS